MRKTLSTLLALAAMAATGFATTFTWTGAAADGDWNNAANWDGNGLPVDDQGTGDSEGLSNQAFADAIVFTGTALPTTNIPGLGGFYDPTAPYINDTPTLSLVRGGAITFSLVGREDAVWTNGPGNRDFLTVGDGIGGGTEDVAVTLNKATSGSIQLSRHGNNVVNNLQVHSDGMLTIGSAIDMAWSSSRVSTFTIDGGSVTVNGSVTDITPYGGAYVDFTAVGGSFTAGYGGNFANIADVNASLGVDFLNNAGGDLEAVDNVTSFTVSAVAAADPNYWTGLGGATWDSSTTANFTLNDEADPLINTTFDLATATSGEATFADAYFDGGVSQAVTQSNPTIAAGGVSTTTIAFTNDSVSYEISAADGMGLTGATAVTVTGGGSVTLLSPNTHTGGTLVTGGSTLVLADSLALQNSTLLCDVAPVFDQSASSFILGGLDGVADIVLEDNAGSPAGIELVVGNNGMDTTYTGVLTGAGGLTKIGSGTLTLDDPGAGNTFSGDTVIKEGRVIAGPGNGDLGLSTVSQVLIGDTVGSADATLQFDLASSTAFPSSINYTVQGGNSGVIGLHGSGFSQVMGTVTLGSAGSAGKGVTLSQVGSSGWDLRFLGVIQDPVGMTPGTGGTVTISSAAGRNVSFEAANTYSGDTVVESGNFRVQASGSLSFYPTTNGATNQLSGSVAGTGVVTLDGAFDLDLSSADATIGNAWVLVVDTDLASVTYGTDFAVTSTLGTFAESGGVWTLVDGVEEWVFDEATGTLSVGHPQDFKYWTGLGGATWDAATTPNFSNNLQADPVVNTTFDVATALTNAAQFADLYWDNGSTIPVVQDSVTIGSGGVEVGTVQFVNSGVSYTVDSSDANGIKGATSVEVLGGGAVTLRGAHWYTGATVIGSGGLLTLGDGVVDGALGGTAVANEGTFVVHNGGAVSQSGAISGAGGVIKKGVGSLSLTGGSTYSGDTIVEAGSLVVEAGAAIAFYPTTSGSSNQVVGVPSGSGTLQIDGEFFLELSAADATPGNSWVIVDDANLGAVSYGSNVVINSSLGAFYPINGGWTFGAGVNEWKYSEATGVLTFGVAQDNKHWTGLGGAVWDADTTSNFSDNTPGGALVNTTFDVAVASSSEVIFSDYYWESDVATGVAQNLVTIAAGGVETTLVDFRNNVLSYLVDSTDANGIMGGTDVHVGNGGTVTLRGTHAYSGATVIGAGSTLNIGDGALDGSIANSSIENNGSLVFTHGSAVTHNGGLSGIGDVGKAGGGVLTLAQNATYSGGTTISGGALRLLGTSRSSAYAIAGGSVLEFDFASSKDMPVDTRFDGAGTLRKSGGGSIVWKTPSARFALESGSLIDLQGGTFVGGSHADENWTVNRSDLHVASGALFSGVEANVRVDALTGAGTIKSGYPGAGYLTFTFGVDDGSGTFSGSLQDGSFPARFTKEGSGTQVLTGVSTYTGATVVLGTGSLLIDGDHSGVPGLLTVVKGATLGGNGVLGGPCDVDGILAPGTSIGTFSTMDVVLDGTLAIEVDGVASDHLSVVGMLELTGSSVLAVTGNGSGATESVYLIASYSSLTGTFGSEAIPAGFEVDYNYQSLNQIALVADGSMADSDGDGIPDSWEIAQFGNLGTANGSSDFDGDGVSDLKEYVHDTDPTDSASVFTVVFAWVSGTEIEVTYGPVKAGRTYTVVASSDLGLYGVLPGSTHVPTVDAASHTFVDTILIDAEYLRGGG